MKHFIALLALASVAARAIAQLPAVGESRKSEYGWEVKSEKCQRK
ncbi:MAG TPA: hypothetical protein VFG03_17050 [Telluria sp.]|nr:hypothetical protein [Telluria sp.]